MHVLLLITLLYSDLDDAILIQIKIIVIIIISIIVIIISEPPFLALLWQMHMVEFMTAISQVSRDVSVIFLYTAPEVSLRQKQ